MKPEASLPWRAVEPDLEAAFACCRQPLEALARAEIPAIVLRQVWSAEKCSRLIERLIAEELLFDPRLPVPDKFRQAAIPEGYYREGKNSQATLAWKSAAESGKTRIDIGTSLGYRGSNPEEYFQHSRETIDLFERLFSGEDDPVRVLYHNLEALSAGKRVLSAREPDGRLYGPAIIRAHYGGYTYKPHFDSVRLREKREDYAVHQFEHQFAGVLVLQNTQLGDSSAQCILHRCLWTDEVDPHLKDDTFHEFAKQRRIENVEVCLEPGDLYFFNTRLIHEVPGVAGEQPRVVLATFIGYSADRPEIFVWA